MLPTILIQRLLKQNDVLYTVFDGHPVINLTPKAADPRELEIVRDTCAC